MEFITLTVVTCVVLIFIVRFSLHNRIPNPAGKVNVILLLIVLAVSCMFLGKYGATWGLPWWIYYPVPMLLVLLLPVLLFRMKRTEAIIYVVLSMISGPVIHLIFSLFGWKNYLPFIHIPSLREMLL